MFSEDHRPAGARGEQTLILTGTKVGGERPAPKTPEATAPLRSRRGQFPVLWLCLPSWSVLSPPSHSCIAAQFSGTPTPLAAKDGATNQTSQVKKAAPALPAPPANDTNWVLDLKGAVITDSIAAGRVKGQDFISERATLQGGLLTLRNGDLSISINFANATAQMLSGKTINVATNAATAARVTLHWKDGDHAMHEVFNSGYAMLLDFGEATNNRISGKIYLCTTDEQKSYVAGTFKAEIRKPKPKH